MPTNLSVNEDTLTETPLTGLSDTEAARRLALGYDNSMPDKLSRSLWQILWANVFTLFNAIVFGGFTVLLVLGRWQDALFGLPALFNTLIGVWQEFSAKRTLDELKVLNAPTARVLREGRLIEVKPHRVVLGDLVALQVGDQVAADAILVRDAGCEQATRAAYGDCLDVDESLLTGESDAIRKEVGDEVLSGSTIAQGTALARVIRVGEASFVAKMTAQAKRFQLVRSELREHVDRLLRYITWALPVVAAIVITGQWRAGGWPQEELTPEAWTLAVVGAVAAIIAMVPLGLVLVTSIAFAVAGVKLAQNQVLMNELPAVEGLARVDMFCVDKTGTLTTGELRFDALHPLTHVPSVESVLGHFGSVPDANSTARCLAQEFQTGQLRVACEVAFDSARKWSAIEIHDLSEGSPGVWVFGASEMVLQTSDHELVDEVLDRAGELASQGLRTLLLAHAPHAQIDEADPVLPPSLMPVALITFREQVRDDAAPAIQFFAEQGVQIRVISGDDPRTALAVAREVGLEVASGFDARELPDDTDELAELMERQTVFGRVTPHQKYRMVKALQSRGHVVAMTGDGVNDVLAIKEADLGIAVDTAAASTRAVARLVLLDGRFARLPGVVAEGRKVIANIERVSKMFLTKTTYAFGVGVLFGLLAINFPFLPRQLSLTDGLTIGIPAFFLALLPNTQRYRPGFLRRSLLFSVPTGIIVTVALFTVHLMGQNLGGFDDRVMQSASTLTLAGITLWVLAVLARPWRWVRFLIVISMYAGLALAWFIPFVRDFFELSFLPEPLAWVVLMVVSTGVVLVELLRVWHARVTASNVTPASKAA